MKKSATLRPSTGARAREERELSLEGTQAYSVVIMERRRRRAFEVGAEIVDILDADPKPDRSGPDARPARASRPTESVGCCMAGAMTSDSTIEPEARGDREQLERLGEPAARLEAAADVERDDGAEIHLRACERVTGIAGGG